MPHKRIFCCNSKHQLNFIENILNPENTIVALIGGRQSGKSWAGAAGVGCLIQDIKRCKKGVGWVICPDYPQSRAACDAIEGVLGWKPEGGIIVERQSAANTYVIERPDGSYFKLEIKTGTNPDGLRGRAVDFLWFDEGALMEEYCWSGALPTILSTGGPIFITTTPKGKNWFYEKVFLKSLEDKSIIVIHGTTDDNPDLTPKMKNVIKSQHSGLFYKQEILAEFVSMEGLVWNMKEATIFDPSQIKLPKGEVIGAIDFGFRDPFVYLWTLKVDGRFYVLDEHYQNGWTLDRHVQAIKSNPLEKLVQKRWADPSAAQARADIERLGLGTWQAQNDRNYGINIVARYLESDKLNISKRCKNGIREMHNWQWSKKGEVPEDKDNHFCDALRYLLASEEALGAGPTFPVTYVDRNGQIIIEEGEGGFSGIVPTQDNPDPNGSYPIFIDGEEYH